MSILMPSGHRIDDPARRMYMGDAKANIGNRAVRRAEHGETEARSFGSAREAMEAALAFVVVQLGMRSGAVTRVTSDARRLQFVATHTMPGGCALTGDDIPFVDESGRAKRVPSGAVSLSPLVERMHGAAAHERALRAALDVGSYVGVPIVLGDQSVYGMLGVFDADRRTAGPEHIETLHLFARLLASQIDAERLRQRHELLLGAAGDGIVGLNRDGLISFVNPAAAGALGYAPEDLFGRDHHVVFHQARGDGSAYPVAECPIASTLREGTTQRVTDDVFWRRTGAAIPVEFVTAPLLDRGGVEGAAVVFKDQTESKAFEDEMLRLAFHDPLTALPNRTHFVDRLEQVLACEEGPGKGAAVLFLDLDRFKNINDGLGHAAGDELLMTAAQRLADCVRAEDTVARFGGDEFAILLVGVKHANDAVLTAERIIAAIEAPFLLDEHEAFVSTSIGIAIAGPQVEAGALLRDAGVALYRAKADGKARCVVFNQSMPMSSVERLGLESDLRHALERQELRVYYQPVLDLHSGSIVGAEALIRWEHPRHGLVSPLEFIPLAEETGLILPIGHWVLQEACRQARLWQRQHADYSQFVISVNLSARQFQQADLLEQVETILRETGLDPACLRLEITESVLMEDADATYAQLHALRTLGAKLAIDDFGTGYSSLSYIQRFPIDVLKIDRSFVSGLGDDARNPSIIQATVTLAHALGMEVTAEGIETADQVRSLQDLKCDHGQGYFYARPVTSVAIDSLLANGIPHALATASPREDPRANAA